jgi:methylenetetrahydrofolate dehydrogenase (NADP+)/methenyltetrahydrofolate cyclohydrolase
MSTTIIDGKAFAEKVRADVAEEVSALKAQGITPGLAVVLVGSDPASEVYVRNKGKKTIEVGMESFEHKLPETTTQGELLTLVEKLNRDEKVNGILVQLPLPEQINEHAIIAAIDPAKDVDGFHDINTGRLVTGEQGLIPCTSLGCLMMLKDVIGDLSGKHAVVIGRSNIVGKPMAALLLNESCTVTVTHSRTQDLPQEIKRADIVVAAVGRPEMVKGEWIKPGAVVVDVGINRTEVGDKTKLVGDVAFSEVSQVASAITPVPGGVGPMTIACLLANTVKATKMQHGVLF